MFVLLLAGYLLSALLAGRVARLASTAGYLIVFLLALRPGPLPGRWARVLRWSLGIGSTVVAVLALAVPGRTTAGIVALWLAVVALLTAVSVLWRVLGHRVVTLQTVFGALSAYLLIGFLFAAVFMALVAFDHRPFFAAGQPADGAAVQYFSFVTLTTTGYGDLTAAHTAGQTVAALEAVLGQVFLVTLVARLVSVIGMARPPPPRLERPADARGDDRPPSGIRHQTGDR